MPPCHDGKEEEVEEEEEEERERRRKKRFANSLRISSALILAEKMRRRRREGRKGRLHSQSRTGRQADRAGGGSLDLTKQNTMHDDMMVP